MSDDASKHTDGGYLLNDKGEEHFIDNEYEEYEDDDEYEDEAQIPVPNNISVVLASWTPPSIRVSWAFKDPAEEGLPSTPYPFFPISTTTEPSLLTPDGKRKRKKRPPRKLEAFRIIYHPIRTK